MARVKGAKGGIVGGPPKGELSNVVGSLKNRSLRVTS